MLTYRYKDTLAINSGDKTIYLSYRDIQRLIELLPKYIKDIQDTQHTESKLK